MFRRIRTKLRKHGHDQTEDSPARGSAIPRDEPEQETPSIIEFRRRNLWEIAFDKLDHLEKEQLAVDKVDSLAKILENVIDHTKGKYGMYKKGDLQIRGKSINIRESTKKIISAAIQFQGLIDGLVSLDQSSHVSGPWSVVSFGLTLIKNDIERRDSIMEASEYLAGALEYHAIIDNQYRYQNTESNHGLENALIEVYTAILKYTAEVKRATGEGRGVRIYKSIAALGGEPLNTLKQAIEQKSDVISKWKTLSHDAYQAQKAEQILADVDEMTKKVDSVDSRIRSNEELEILEWLSKASYSQTQNNTQDRRTTDTGDWFLQSQEYIQWRNHPGTILWLHGAVGCGKSVLCSSIIKDIENYCVDHAEKKLAYWYFQFSNDESQNVDNMIRSILRQLSPTPLPEYIFRLWEEKRQGREPAKEKLLEAINSILDNGQSDVFLVFDALDECPQRTLGGRRERDNLLTVMETLLQNHHENIHILATSRPEPDIQSKLGKHTSFNLELGLNQDVETFINNELEHGKLRIWKPHVHKKIRERLLNVPERRFRWADLQIKRLEECHMEPDIIETLETIPDSLEETYRGILAQVSKKYQGAARSILIWLSFSAVPLTLKETAEVAGFPFEHSVVEVCTTSMVTTNTNDTIKLAHFSVKEFLVTETFLETSAWYHFSPTTGHRAILERAVSDLIHQDEFSSTQTVKEERPLLIYAASHWESHALIDDVSNTASSVCSDIGRLFTESPIYVKWMQLRHCATYEMPINVGPEGLEPPLYQASKMGFLPIVEELLAAGADPLDPFLDPLYFFTPQTALHVASREGHLLILEILLKSTGRITREVVWGILQDLDCRRHGGEQAEAIIDLLWTMGTLINEESQVENEIDEECFRRATANLRSGPLLMSILLDWHDKFNVPLTEVILRSALQNVEHREDILEVIFKYRGTDVPLTDYVISTLASTWQNDLVVGLVVKQWGSIFPKDQKTLCYFAKKGTWNAMEFVLPLFDDTIISSLETLSAAAQNPDYVDTLKFLLRKRKPGTVLDKKVYIAAAENEFNGLEHIKVLLDDCGPETYMGEDILKAATSNPNQGLDIVQLILKKQQAGFTVTEMVLIEAALKHGEEMLQLLTDNAESSLVITERVLCAAAENVKKPDSAIGYFLDLYQEDFPITERILASAASNNMMSEEVFSKLLDTFGNFKIPETVFEEAFRCPKKLSMLLDKPYDKLPVHSILYHTASKLYIRAVDVVKILLDRQLVVVNEKAIEIVAENKWALELLLDANPEVFISEEALLGAVRDNNPDSLSLLLSKWGNDRQISEKIMEAAAGSREAIQLFQQLFDKQGPRVPITEKIVLRAAQLRDKGAFEMLLGQKRCLDLQMVWEAIWIGDCCQKQAASKVLLKYAELNVSENMLKNMRSSLDTCSDDVTYESLPGLSMSDNYAQEDLGNYRFDGLIRFSMRSKIPISRAEKAVEIIREKCCKNTVLSYMEYQTDFVFTTGHAEVAMKSKNGMEACQITPY